MYIKDPTKRVQYTFRIREDLMEDLKAYSKAKDQKMPRILNDMISQYLEGMSLSNTWLREELGAFITIPNEIPTTYPIDLLNNDGDGLTCEIKAMPNNLAIWNDNDGYISNTPNVLYEGVEPYIMPELIKNLTLDSQNRAVQTIKNVSKCLFGIHILKYKNGLLEVKLINIDEAINRLYKVNVKMAKIFVTHRKLLQVEINRALDHINEVNQEKVKKELLENLEELAHGINTGNVVPIAYHSTAHDKRKDIIATNNEKDILLSRNPYLINTELQKEIDELKKENKELNERIMRIDEILERTAHIVDKVKKN